MPRFSNFYLICIFIYESFKNREEQDFHVEGHGPVLDVPDVVLDALVDRGVAAEAVDLGPAGHARADLMLDHVARDFFLKHLDELGALRTRADEGHLAGEDVEELRELVDGGFPDEAADAGDARVARDGPALLFVGFGLLHHGAELIHHERLVMKADTLLLEDDRARRGELDEGRDDEHDRAEEDDADEGTADVDGTLRGGLDRVGERDVPDVDDREAVHVFGDRLRVDDVVIVRDELRVNTGLLADVDDPVELRVGCERQGDRDFVDGVLREDVLELGDAADDTNALVAFADFGDVVDDAVDVVAPVRVAAAGVDELVGGVREANEHDVLLVEALPAEAREDVADAEAFDRRQGDVDDRERDEHTGREVAEVSGASEREEDRGQQHETDGAGLADVPELGALRVGALRLVQVERPVEKEVRRYDRNERSKIDLRREYAVACREDRCDDRQEPCEGVGRADDEDVQKDMKLI